MHTRGESDTSPHTARASRDPGIWVPIGFGVVRAGLRGTSGSTGSLSPVSKVEAQDYYTFVEWRRQNCSDRPGVALEWSTELVKKGVHTIHAVDPTAHTYSYLRFARYTVGSGDAPPLGSQLIGLVTAG